MLTHCGFSAWITVDDDAQLPEYLVAVDDEAHRVSCWVPGEEGKKFTVWWQDHGGKVDTCSYISLDGITVPGRFLLGEGIASRSGARADPYRERPFKFMEVPKDTDGAADSNADAGTIVLKIKRVRRIEDTVANAVETLPESVLSNRKAGDLCVGLGPIDETAKPQYPRTWKCVPYDTTPGNSPHPSTYVSFVFRYRTQEFLETQGIAEKKKTIPLRRGSTAVDRRLSGSLPPSGVDHAQDTDCPSPPKRQRMGDQTALGHGSAPSASAGQRAPSTDLRRTVSYYRAQAFMQSASPSASTPTSSHPSPVPSSEPSIQSAAPSPQYETHPPQPHAQAHPQPQSGPQPIELIEFTPPEPQTRGSHNNSKSSSSTTVPSTPTFNPYLPILHGPGQNLFLLPRTTSQSRVSSLTLEAAPTPSPAGVPVPLPMPMPVPMSMQGLPVQMYPYYPYPGSLVGTPIQGNPIPLPSIPPPGAYAYPGLGPHAWMGNAMGYHPLAQNGAHPVTQRKVSAGTLTAAPSMSALSDATAPSPSIASIDGDGHGGGEREHEREKKEVAAKAKARRRRREGVR